MQISSVHVGAFTMELEVEITDRLAMNYAASVGDDNPLYLHDERDGGIIAPPLSCMEVTWPLSSEILMTWDIESFTEPFPFDLLQQQVHYRETIVFHRVLRPGDKLRAKGTIAAILPHRAGTELVVRYDAVAPDGTLMFTEYIGALLRRVRCLDEGRGAESLPAVPACPTPDACKWDLVLPIDPLAAHVYDGCTNMHFPIHTSVKFAKSVGLQGIILQGAATLSYALREITNREMDGDPTRMRSTSCTFTGMVTPGSSIHIRLLHRRDVDDGTELFYDVVNSEGRRAISGGYVLLGPSRL